MRHTSRPSEMSSTTRATGHRPRNGLTGSPISSSMQATSYMVNNLVITSALFSSFFTSSHLTIIIITRVLIRLKPHPPPHIYHPSCTETLTTIFLISAIPRFPYILVALLLLYSILFKSCLTYLSPLPSLFWVWMELICFALSFFSPFSCL